MFDEEDDLQDDQFNAELDRFESMRKMGEAYYFDPEVLEQIIDFYILRSQFKKALYAANYGINQHPLHLAFNLKKAQTFTATGRLKESLTILLELERIDSFNTEVYVTIANVFSQLRDHDKAIKYYEKALSLDEFDQDDEDLIELQLDLALEYENIGQYHKAIQVLERVLNNNTDNEAAIYEIAYCYERIGEFDKCIEYYNLYIDNNPYSFTAWYNLGNIYFLKKNYEKAIWAYDYSIIINENFASAYFNLGNTYMQQEDIEKAISAYKECLKIDPNDALTLCYLGEAYERTEDYETALYYYEQSKTVNPDMADAWLGIGIVKDLLGYTNQAVSFILHAVQLEPENANYKLVLGEAYFKLDRFVEAEQILEQAMIHPDDDYNDILLLLAKIKKEYNLHEAIDFLSVESDKYNFSTKINMYLVSLYWENGQFVEALTLFVESFQKNKEKSVKYLHLYLPESKYSSEFNNIINPHNE